MLISLEIEEVSSMDAILGVKDLLEIVDPFVEKATLGCRSPASDLLSMFELEKEIANAGGRARRLEWQIGGYRIPRHDEVSTLVTCPVCEQVKERICGKETRSSLLY
jgi:hypothetical protein